MRIKPRLGKRPESFNNQAKNASEPTVIVHENWDIYNATRPIPGTVTWVNTEEGAWFYAAQDPTDAGSGLLAERCQELGAALVCWFEIDYVLATLQEYYDSKMPGRVDVSKYDDRIVFQEFVKHVLPTIANEGE